MVAPSMTFNSAGNVRSSASLAAATAATADVDYSTKVEGQVTVKATMGGTVAATHGLRVDAFPGYGSSIVYAATPAASVTIAQTAATSGVDSATLFLPTGKYRLAFTNLDATNAITVEATSATVDSYS